MAKKGKPKKEQITIRTTKHTVIRKKNDEKKDNKKGKPTI